MVLSRRQEASRTLAGVKWTDLMKNRLKFGKKNTVYMHQMQVRERAAEMTGMVIPNV